VIYDPKVSTKQIHEDLISPDVHGGNGQDLEHGLFSSSFFFLFVFQALLCLFKA